MTQLYKKERESQLPSHVPDGEITICTCYADGCNGSPKLSGSSGSRPWRIAAQLLFAVLILLGFTV